MNITAKVTSVTADKLTITLTVGPPTVEFDNGNQSFPIYNKWEILAHEIQCEFDNQYNLYDVNIPILSPSRTWTWTNFNGITPNSSHTISGTITYTSISTHTNTLNITVPIYKYPFGGTSSYVTPEYVYISVDVNIPGKTYTINYNANGGSVTPTSQTKPYSYTVTVPTATRTGYVFKGWGTSSTDTSVDYLPDSVYWNDADATLYAIWEAATYTVTYNANEGSVSPSSKNVTYNSTYGSLPTPTRIGYMFNGWYTKSTGGTKVTSSTKVTTAKNHNIYAQWTAKQLTIIFHKNDNSNDTFTQIVTAGKNDKFGYENGSYRWPDVEDTYEFGHWYKSSNFRIHGWNSSSDGTAEGGKLYATRSDVTDKFIDDKCPQATNTIDLYAKWDTIGKYKVGAQWKDCAIRVLYNDKWKQCMIKEI